MDTKASLREGQWGKLSKSWEVTFITFIMKVARYLNLIDLKKHNPDNVDYKARHHIIIHDFKTYLYVVRTHIYFAQFANKQFECVSPEN